MQPKWFVLDPECGIYQEKWFRERVSRDFEANSGRLGEYAKELTKEFDEKFPQNTPAPIRDKSRKKRFIRMETEEEALKRTKGRSGQILTWLCNHQKELREGAPTKPKILDLQQYNEDEAPRIRAKSPRDFFVAAHPEIGQQARAEAIAKGEKNVQAYIYQVYSQKIKEADMTEFIRLSEEDKKAKAVARESQSKESSREPSTPKEDRKQMLVNLWYTALESSQRWAAQSDTIVFILMGGINENGKLMKWLVSSQHDQPGDIALAIQDCNHPGFSALEAFDDYVLECLQQRNASGTAAADLTKTDDSVPSPPSRSLYAEESRTSDTSDVNNTERTETESTPPAADPNTVSTLAFAPPGIPKNSSELALSTTADHTEGKTPPTTDSLLPSPSIPSSDALPVVSPANTSQGCNFSTSEHIPPPSLSESARQPAAVLPSGELPPANTGSPTLSHSEAAILPSSDITQSPGRTPSVAQVSGQPKGAEVENTSSSRSSSRRKASASTRMLPPQHTAKRTRGGKKGKADIVLTSGKPGARFWHYVEVPQSRDREETEGLPEGGSLMTDDGVRRSVRKRKSPDDESERLPDTHIALLRRYQAAVEKARELAKEMQIIERDARSISEPERQAGASAAQTPRAIGSGTSLVALPKIPSLVSAIEGSASRKPAQPETSTVKSTGNRDIDRDEGIIDLTVESRGSELKLMNPLDNYIDLTAESDTE
ncbi:hypothetical protein K474DRAFT_1703411 [Panus rudis PR-1116 ss-1]|nr:hypothetical protein K474DRAFT_1703411 [Panus rudis PR-1116 ss-1]